MSLNVLSNGDLFVTADDPWIGRLGPDGAHAGGRAAADGSLGPAEQVSPLSHIRLRDGRLGGKGAARWRKRAYRDGLPMQNEITLTSELRILDLVPWLLPVTTSQPATAW